MEKEIKEKLNSEVITETKAEYLGISDQEARDEKENDERAIELQKDTNIASEEILNDLILVNSKENTTLLDLTNTFFDGLINNITDEKITMELAFIKNKITYIISSLKI